MNLFTLSFLFPTLVQAQPLVELKDAFGENVVPYHHTIGRKKSYRQINASLRRKGFGPRTFVRKDVYTILSNAFNDLNNKPLKLVYGEGSWGGKYGSKALKPHRTHKNGSYLDIFVPIVNRTGEPVFFPITKQNLFGYAVNFDKNGSGQGKHKKYQIDWNGMIYLLDSLCTHGEKKIKKILIARDLFPSLKMHWSPITKKCQNKIKPIGVLGPYRFAGRKLWVDHDDHLHVEFW